MVQIYEGFALKILNLFLLSNVMWFELLYVPDVKGIVGYLNHLSLEKKNQTEIKSKTENKQDIQNNKPNLKIK